MNPNVQRGLLLYQQSRFQQAEPEFRQALAAEPDDAYTRALLALTLSHQERFDDAEAELAQALQADPSLSFVHYARAFVLDGRRHYETAQKAIAEAIELEPEEPDYRALQAQIYLNQRDWKSALAAAEAGLAEDPEHVQCANLRAIALVRLGRREEAGQTIDAALSKDPENSVTHANQGWTLLHAGQQGKALEHFRESLRLDPENEWARQGTIEALKARYFTYSLLLRYFLWMSRLSRQMQWIVILGGVFGMRALRGLARSNPDLEPYVFPIQIVYLAFVFLTWTAEPLFNLLLRLNKFGRMVLSDKERTASNWVGGFMGVAVLCLCLAALYWPMIAGAFVFGFSVLPVAAIFNCPEGWPRRLMVAYTIAVVGAGAGALAIMGWAMITPEVRMQELKALFAPLLGLFGLGIMFAGWVANILIMQRVRK